MCTSTHAPAAAEGCPPRQPGDEPRPLPDNLTPRQYLDLLIEKQQVPEAAELLALLLPKREAVWWACLCAREAYGPNPTARAAAALRAAETWATEPSEDHRRAAFPAAEVAGLGTPAGCAAVAAFWSGGSLGPPPVPDIPPQEHLTARAVAGAVLLAGVLIGPEKAAAKYRQFFAVGKGVADGTHRWPEAGR